MNRADSGTTGPTGANLRALRGHNAAVVLELLRGSGGEGVSRLELAARAGLTPQAVSKIVARLRGDGLVADAGRRASTGGKPAMALRLVPEAGGAVGVHLERDALVAVLVDLAGAVVAERRVGVDFPAGAEAVVDLVAREVRVLADAAGAALGPTGLLGAGVALPGPLDHVRGVLHRVTGFPGWDGFPLREALAARLGLPVVVDKDTNAAALGIALGGGAESFAYLHLGTGLGAGLVLGGGLYRGPRTGAGEFGHQVVLLDGPVCECGDRGCLEALCLAAVARGDLESAARLLGTGAGNLVSLLDIDLVLLGGRTVAAAEDLFVRGVGAVVAARSRREGARGRVGVGIAPGGERGVAEGAAQLVLAPLFGHADAALPGRGTG
ncbi:ROK family transcriptional regulator [Streptomyces spectabilis]|uniref:Putative NBD/HSP70 family sugar kinase n=1 Tax=Streptomyces spectabilis TaxID=68270 RepID=A0A5P2XAA0_STRST|nr:ROK family transcriptional regulator [Streptomyces spectabilis]MBB5106323.1 putative NBD/HSP70 family sugar kinase [Streptomyces spectabilis]MCI3902936.1 ROK family protein [Streptomyces spectabilis]QEV60209.1 ROK family protein [Streptomyces spectabilis]GGV33384.1 transcriptional regulator [Streptomyces spectabilis]